MNIEKMIEIAKHSGFCPGVKKAVDTALSYSGEEISILGELIHNDFVMQSLKAKNICVINSPTECKTKKILIRSHGEPKSTLELCKKLGLEVVDCTCEFVKNIHKIVEEYSEKGYLIAIVGKKSHCEVQGICGWCKDSIVLENDDFELKNDQNVCLVAQTTCQKDVFDKFSKKITEKCAKIVEIFCTICYTTSIRQKEAMDLASRFEAVIVVGDKTSNNTNELWQVCKKINRNVLRIERASEITKEFKQKFKNIAIVAGASTPMELILEVKGFMEEQNNVMTEAVEEKTQEVVQNEVVDTQEVASTNEEVAEAIAEPKEIATMDDVMQAMDKQSQGIRKGQKAKAVIIQAGDEGLMLKIGVSKKELLMSKDEITIDGSYSKENYKSGEEIEVMITGVNPLTVSAKRLAIGKIAEETASSLADGKEFKLVIDGFNKGGVTGVYENCNVFVPASQIRLGFVKNDPEELKKYVGKELKVVAIKIEGRKIVASAKVILEKEKEARLEKKKENIAQFFASIQVGNIVSGKVVRFTDFGAFVNVEGFDCLAHISDLSWTNIAKAEDILKKDEIYNFVILKIDQERERVSIGYKQLQPRPWQIAGEKYHEGDTVTGKIVRIAPFGAFVNIEPGIDGLVHVSQITYDWIEKAEQVLKVGDEVTAKIIDINPTAEKMSLSIKALLEKPEQPEKEESAEEGEGAGDKRQSRRKFDRYEKKAKVEKEDDTPREWVADRSAGATITDLLKGLNIVTEEPAEEPVEEVKAKKPRASKKKAEETAENTEE